MYPVGHVVVACGSVWGASRILPDETPSSRLARFLRAIDYRWIALGALLPDLIDKPLFWTGVIANEHGGHWWGHALIVYAVMFVVGVAFAKTGHAELVLLALGGFSHIAIDSTTHVPHSILWPFVTLHVPRNSTFVSATNVAGEFFGSLLVLWYFAKSYRKGRLRALLRTGAV